jgi:hypothetical protein
MRAQKRPVSQVPIIVVDFHIHSAHGGFQCDAPLTVLSSASYPFSARTILQSPPCLHRAL